MPTAPWRRRYVIKHACGSKTTTRARVPKEIREVGVDDVRVTPEQPLVHLYDGLPGASKVWATVNSWRCLNFHRDRTVGGVGARLHRPAPGRAS